MNGSLHHLRIAVGIGVCSYEAAALAVNDAETLPPITAMCHRHPLLAVAISAWVAQHLLRPWLPVRHAPAD